MRRKLPCIALALASLCTSSQAFARDPTTVTWSEDWRPVHWWEAAAAVGLVLGDDQLEFRWPHPTSASWTQPLLFDSWARTELRGRTASIQEFASTASDIMYRGGALVPLVVDDYFGAASLHENADLAWRLAAIDLESFGVAGLVSITVEHSVGRARPYTESCDASGRVFDSDGHVVHTCGTTNDFRSFFSGHATSTATTAGLVCVHHQHLPLFGGGAADLAPCLFMISVSAATGVLRLVYDEHWASDVLMGWLDGAFSGYVLPSLLHFGFGSAGPPQDIEVGSAHLMPTLLPRSGGAELGVMGVF